MSAAGEITDSPNTRITACIFANTPINRGSAYFLAGFEALMRREISCGKIGEKAPKIFLEKKFE